MPARSGLAPSVATALIALSAITHPAVQAQVDTQETLVGIPAAAQTQRLLTPSEEFVRRRPIGLFPSISVGLEHHSNVRRTSDNEQSDTALIITPALAYRTDLRNRHKADVNYAARVVRYNDLDEEDITSHSLDGALRFDLTPRLKLRVFAEYNKSYEERGASGSRTFISEQPDKVDWWAYGGEVVFGRRTQTFQVALTASTSELRYQNNDQKFRDRDYDRVSGTLFYNVGVRTSLILQLQHADIDYLQRDPNLNSDENGYFVGVRWEATMATDAEAKIGRLEKDLTDPALDDFEGTSYLARVNWRPKPYTRFYVSATRTTEEVAETEFDPDGPGFFVSRLIGVGWDHNLTDRLGFIAFFNHTRDTSPNSRRDTIHDFGLGLRYRINPWLGLAARYGEVERDSNEPDAEYKDRMALISLRASFQMGSGRR